jgi:hypothetical protein
MGVAITASMRAETAGRDSVQGHADGEVRSAVVQRARRESSGARHQAMQLKDEGWDSGASQAPRQH